MGLSVWGRSRKKWRLCEHRRLVFRRKSELPCPYVGQIRTLKMAAAFLTLLTANELGLVTSIRGRNLASLQRRRWIPAFAGKTFVNHQF